MENQQDTTAAELAESFGSILAKVRAELNRDQEQFSRVLAISGAKLKKDSTSPVSQREIVVKCDNYKKIIGQMDETAAEFKAIEADAKALQTVTAVTLAA